MHRPIPEQGGWIKQVVRGFFAYHAVPTNGAALRAFSYHVKRIWLHTLRRRSQKDRFSWQRMHSLTEGGGDDSRELRVDRNNELSAGLPALLTTIPAAGWPIFFGGVPTFCHDCRP
jgi:hypothetical protein